MKIFSVFCFKKITCSYQWNNEKRIPGIRCSAAESAIFFVDLMMMLMTMMLMTMITMMTMMTMMMMTMLMLAMMMLMMMMMTLATATVIQQSYNHIGIRFSLVLEHDFFACVFLFRKDYLRLRRFVFARGEPGAGKSEAIAYAAQEAAERGGRVLIGCPTGVLVSAYRDRLPQSDRITAETIHSAWRISRKADAGTHNPPSRLRTYDVIFIDEASQLENAVFVILLKAILELPQKPLVIIVGDFSQLQPIRGGGTLYKFVHQDKMRKVTMEQHEFARSKDPILLDFLSKVRKSQPTRQDLRAFFGSRYLGQNLREAVRKCLAITGSNGIPMTWLTCLTKGAAAVNYEYLYQLGYGTAEDIAKAPDAYPCDPDYGSVPMIIRPGMWLRLTRNLDKDRGFCNGALGIVEELLQVGRGGAVFTMRLTHGCMVLVHPISDEQGQRFLPCTYGYGMTTRKAQGATLDYAVLYFDLWRPASRGYGYVGASRVKRHDGLFYFGTMRRTDWLPVGGPGEPIEQEERSVLSADEDPDYDHADTSDEEQSDDADYDASGQEEDSEDDGNCNIGRLLLGDDDADRDSETDLDMSAMTAAGCDSGDIAALLAD